jgi:hypothetical protein
VVVLELEVLVVPEELEALVGPVVGLAGQVVPEV